MHPIQHISKVNKFLSKNAKSLTRIIKYLTNISILLLMKWVFVALPDASPCI